MKKTALLLCVAMGLSLSAHAADSVYTWKNQKGGVYSDVPQNLQSTGVSTVNIRTHASTPINPNEAQENAEKNLTLAERQAKLSMEIAEENKRIAEKNKKRDEEMKKQNCRIARTNLKNAEVAGNMPNRDQMIAGYRKDVDSYCN